MGNLSAKAMGGHKPVFLSGERDWLLARLERECDLDKIAAHSSSIFWYVLPSLPMFLLLPWLLRLKLPFGWAMLAACLLTMGLYVLMARALAHWQIAI